MFRHRPPIMQCAAFDIRQQTANAQRFKVILPALLLEGGHIPLHGNFVVNRLDGGGKRVGGLRAQQLGVARVAAAPVINARRERVKRDLVKSDIGPSSFGLIARSLCETI